MRSYESRAEILRLVEEGINDCEIARRTGVPRTAVRDIRHTAPTGRPACPRCWRLMKPIAPTPESYAELLGLYLGDGCISSMGRTHRLRIALDSGYPRIVAETSALLGEVFPQHAIGTTVADGGATTVVWVYASHLPCLFPQHGPGKKHHRSMLLEPWQEECLRAAPWRFLRGCFRSDGCAFVNRTGRYAYLSYDFTNYSVEILDAYARVCDLVGVMYRRYPRSIRIYRRPSVALFEAHVGLKT
jgi:Homeodomain-like domain/LAGLIDADG-like domain